MGIRVERVVLVYESICMETVIPRYLGISQESAEEYLQKHPYPEDKAYTKDDLLADLSCGGGMWTLPDRIRDETMAYISDMISELM